MGTKQCPICYCPLEVRDVAPCMECGGYPDEIDHFLQGKHTYYEYEVFEGLNLILCNFCVVDFSSYDPTFFGLPKGSGIGLGYMIFKRSINNPTLSKDKFCPECGYRLAFLNFLVKARELHAS
jgi:hypothetical protein